MNFPKYFTFEELVNSDTAKEKNIDNVPNFEHIVNLYCLCDKVLDPARKELGRPITVTSGYRSPELNKEVGGVSNSQHLTGCAADLKCTNLVELFDILSENPEIDQLLFEDNGVTRWIHVSIPEQGKTPRRQINRNYKAYIKR
nr:MAG: Peptidase M15 [Bacteriophage sp.]